MAAIDLTGKWTSKYEFGDSDSRVYEVVFELADNNLLVGKSTNKTGTVLTMMLEYDAENRVLTGAWHERAAGTKPPSEAAHGSLQLLLNDKLDSARGKWLGFDRTRSRINIGNWILQKKRAYVIK